MLTLDNQFYFTKMPPGLTKTLKKVGDNCVVEPKARSLVSETELYDSDGNLTDKVRVSADENLAENLMVLNS